MDIIPARTLELVEPGEVTALCFHPDRPSIYLALTDRILAYDLLTNTVTGRAKVDRGARITHLVTSNDYLVAATDDGHIYTFEGEYANPTHVGAMGLSCVFSPPKSPEKRAIQGLCISPIMPWLFYSKAMTREINVIDLQAKTKSSWKMETKKPVAAFACHPIQPLLVVANTDNLIRVWDYKNKRLASQSDDFAGLAMKGGLIGSSVCKILFYPKKEILIAIGRDGLIVVWEIAKNSTLTCYGGRKISTKQGMIEGAFFHHTLPFFSTISTQGELRSWKLDIAAKKIPVQPAGYTQPFNALSTEMERRLQRLGAFSKNFHPPSLRATDVILHDELNYMAFSYDLTKQGTTGDHLLTSSLQRNHYVVHSLLSRTEPLLVLPKVDTLDVPPLFFQEEKFAFDYPQSKFHFVDSTKIISHSIIERNNLLEADLPEHEFDKTCALHTTRFHYSPKQKQYLVFYQSYSMVDPGSSKSLDHLLLPDSPTSSDSDVSKTSTSTLEPRSNYFYALVYGGPDREAENMSNLRRGRDGCFIGATNLEYVTLAENGEAITIRNIPSSEVKNQYEIRLKAPMSRIFHTPLSNERAIFFFDENNYQLILSMNAVTGSNAVSEFAPCIQSQEQLEAYHRHHHHHKKESNNNNDDDVEDDDEAENAASKKVANTKPIFNPHKHLLQLSRDQRERVLDVKWKTYAHSAKYHLAAILTTTSIRIISVTLQGEIELLCSVHAPQDYIQLDRSNDRQQQNNNLYFHSIYWVGNAVLCTTPSHLQYVTANGALRPLSSLENTGAVIATVMNDRLLYATAYKDRTQIRVLPVGLLEPLLLGEVCLPNHLLPSQSHLRSTLARLVERFDGRRITPYLVDQLDKRGFPDLALALVEKSPRFQILHKHHLALRALSFRKALQFLVDAHKTCSDYPKLSYQSPLHSKFLNLGKIAVRYGQFKVAEQCYATAKDFYSLLYIYAINGNRDKIKALQEQVKKEGSLVSSSASSPVAGSKGGLRKNKGKEKALLTKPSKQVTLDDRNWQKLDEVNTTLFTLEDACQVYLDNLKENERVEPLDWAYETPGTNSHWNIMRGTTSIVRVRKEDGSKGSVVPMQLQNVNQWLNSKVDWNILFISTTYRNSGPDTQEAGDGHAEDGVVGEGTANLAPPSRLDYIRTKYKTVTDSSSPTLRRSLSDENLPKFNPTSTEEVSDSDSEPDSESESFSEATSMGGRSVGVVGTNFNVLSEDSNAEDEDDDSTSSSTSTHGKKLRTASSPPPINNDASGSTSPRPGTTTPASPEEERDVAEKGDAREKERESNRDHSEGASSARSSTRDRSKRKRQKGRTRSAASSILSLREDTFEGSFTDRTQDDVDEDEVDEEVNQDAAKHVSSADHSKFRFELPTPHLGIPATAAIPPLGVPRVRKTTSSEYITSCMQNFEKGFLSAALEDAEASIRHLRTEKDSAAKRREMKFSVAYMLALTLLIDIKRLDKLQQGTLENGDGSSSTNNHPPAKMIATKNTSSRTSFSSFSEEGSSMTTSSSTATANKSLGFLSKCLAEIPLAPPHREICQRIAIEYNTKEGNHTYVRELIAADMLNEDLLVRPPPPTKRTDDRARAAAYPPDREELRERSKEAASKGGANATLPSYCCPHCSYTSVPLSNKCESCNNRIRFCFKTQDLIRSKTFYQCPYCDAFYKEDVGKCRFCGLHNAEKQEIP